jgi:hypothetical protein
LAGDITLQDGHLVLARNGLEFALEPEGSSLEELQGFLRRFDGHSTLDEIQSGLTAEQRTRLGSLVKDLDAYHLLDDASTAQAPSGMQVLLELEDLANQIMMKTLARNVFWTHLVTQPEQVPEQVFYGLAIENYHLLFRESLFDSPVLSFQSNTQVRLLMNEFYAGELGHDELVLKALGAVGITRAQMMDGIPLPETMAMANALSYWAASDPYFFLSTLGVLEGKDAPQDRFLEACERRKLNPAFIAPMRAHSEINRKGEHGNLTRLMFQTIPCIDTETVRRMRRQTYLFVEMYDNFFTAIWNHYTTAKDWVRQISKV